MRTTDSVAVGAGFSRLTGAFAWTGAALFLASLSYFLFSYAVTFGETAPAEPSGSAVLVDVALFTVFALHHSVFARARVRAWVERHVPPALERSVYVWLSSLMLIGVCALWQPVPGVAWRVTGAAAWAMYAAQLVGLWLALRSAAIIDIWELSGVRGQGSGANGRRSAADGQAMEFKASGPYGWVRHPIYSGWFLMVFFAPAMTMTRLVFAIVSSAYLLIAMPFEERSLVKSSGGAYEHYMRRVRWKLIPGVY
jgi:protein-S-isoprenylcysteine O-methyltransferase Ste14